MSLLDVRKELLGNPEHLVSVDAASALSEEVERNCGKRPETRAIRKDADQNQVFEVISVNSGVELLSTLAVLNEVLPGKVYYRGQSKVYDIHPQAGAFRSKPGNMFGKMCSKSNVPFHSPLGDGCGLISSSTAPLSCGVCEGLNDRLGPEFPDFPNVVIESLFQHYSEGTTFVDVVGNIWVALWMATRKYESGRIIEEYGAKYKDKIVKPSSSRFTYIYAISFGRDDDRIQLGSAFGEGVDLFDSALVIDLSRKLPGKFVRPHSQSGCVYKPRLGGSAPYSAIIEIPTDVAMRCVQNSELLTSECMYPGAGKDKGFDAFLALLRGFQDQAPLDGDFPAPNVYTE